MKIVDPKSRQMNEVLMFRAHLSEHFAWRRNHHGHPSPATWSRRRLHDSISCQGWQSDFGGSHQRIDQRGSLRRSVRQKTSATPQASAADHLGAPRTHGLQTGRQLSAFAAADPRGDLQPPCHAQDRFAQDHDRSVDATGSRSAEASPEHAWQRFGPDPGPGNLRSTAGSEQHGSFGRHASFGAGSFGRHGRPDPNHPGHRTSARHRACARGPASPAQSHQLDFVHSSLIHPGGDL